MPKRIRFIKIIYKGFRWRFLEREVRGDFKEAFTIGRKDTITKNYMADNDVFADVFNYYVYDGKQIIKPESLHEMLDVEDERILSMIPDYPLHLISPESMSDEDLKKIKTNLREVLQFVKYSKNKQMLEKIISGNERYKKLDKSAVQVMKEMTGLKIDIVGEEKEDMIDMCQAWEEMREDARLAGIEEGIKEGEIIGYIRACKELILQDAEIIHKLREKYELSNEEAQKYLQRI